MSNNFEPQFVPQLVPYGQPLNTVKDLKKYHLSYDRSHSAYGCSTTAIVLGNRVFFILKGDHRKALDRISEESGLEGCLNYFLENVKEAHEYSEHNAITGKWKDQFNLMSTFLECADQKMLEKFQNLNKERSNA